jgi:hypothetical protein
MDYVNVTMTQLRELDLATSLRTASWRKQRTDWDSAEFWED